MTASAPPHHHMNVVHEAEVDGGHSGRLRVVAATNAAGDPLVFVDSDLLGAQRLVLTLDEAKAVGHEISCIAFRTEHLLSVAAATL